MSEEQKSLKQYCKEALKRLKTGFWKNYHDNLDEELLKAEKAGVSASKVKEYYSAKVSDDIKSHKEEQELFYAKVKKLLDEEGEVSNAIGRLTDFNVFDSLSYDDKQRYTLTLSEQYLKAVERYNKEKAMDFNK